jgi:hypothetical protein
MLSWAELLNPAPDVTCPAPITPSLCHTASYKVNYNVQATRQLTLSHLYTYHPGTLVEYPETTVAGHVGHLFELDADNWVNPTNAFAYSQGLPGGRSKKSQMRYCQLLVDREGHTVPCHVAHSTCMRRSLIYMEYLKFSLRHSIFLRSRMQSLSILRQG